MKNEDILVFSKSGDLNSISYGKSVLDGMFEYISGSKFYSLDLLSVIHQVAF